MPTPALDFSEAFCFWSKDSFSSQDHQHLSRAIQAGKKMSHDAWEHFVRIVSQETQVNSPWFEHLQSYLDLHREDFRLDFALSESIAAVNLPMMRLLIDCANAHDLKISNSAYRIFMFFQQSGFSDHIQKKSASEQLEFCELFLQSIFCMSDMKKLLPEEWTLLGLMQSMREGQHPYEFVLEKLPELLEQNPLLLEQFKPIFDLWIEHQPGQCQVLQSIYFSKELEQRLTGTFSESKPTLKPRL